MLCCSSDSTSSFPSAALPCNIPSATLLHHSKCALMKLYFSTKQDVITFCDSCKQDWDQKVNFGNPEGAFSCRRVHDTIGRVAQHLDEVLRFTDEEVVFCSTYKQFCYYWGGTFDRLKFGKPNQKKCWQIPAWARAWWWVRDATRFWWTLGEVRINTNW